MKNIINKLIDQGSVEFNPFTLQTKVPRYSFCVGYSEDDLIDSVTPESVIEDLIENAKDIQSEIVPDCPESSFFCIVYAMDSTYTIYYQWGSDDLKEIIKYALEYDENEILDIKHGDYMTIDEDGNILDEEDNI
jgi:hypothetical protein